MRIAYTIGDKEENVLRQIKAFHELRDKGWTPFIPLLSYYLDLYRSRPYEDWIDLCFTYIEVSRAFCRVGLETPSSGAEREEQKAWSINIPVFYETATVPEFKEFEKDATKS
jgi:hypothetical protein